MNLTINVPSENAAMQKYEPSGMENLVSELWDFGKNDCHSVWCRFGGVTGLSVRYTTGFILNETCNVNVNMGSKPLHMTENLARFYMAYIRYVIINTPLK